VIFELKDFMREMRAAKEELGSWKRCVDGKVSNLEHVMLHLGRQVEQLVAEFPKRRVPTSSDGLKHPEPDSDGPITIPVKRHTGTLSENMSHTCTLSWVGGNTGVQANMLRQSHEQNHQSR
jgi:hypothetical protein